MEKPLNKDETTYGVISYLWLLSFVVFFATLRLPKSEFLENHIKNGIVITIITTIFLLWENAGNIGLPICFILILTGVISAANGKSFPINLLPKNFSLNFLHYENIKKIFSHNEDLPQNKNIEKDKFLAALSYAWILWIPVDIFYSKKSDFIKGHINYSRKIFYISLILMVFPFWTSIFSFFIIILETIGFIFAMSEEEYPQLHFDDAMIKNNNIYNDIMNFLNRYLNIIKNKYRKNIPIYTTISDDEYESISLCYLFLAPFYMMHAFNNDSKIVKFHAIQSSLIIAVLILGIFIKSTIGLPIMILALSTMLIGFLKSYQKEEFLLFDR